MVERKIYMDKIKKLQDQQIIKVVTGVRRCGKSTLLRQFQSYLLSTGVDAFVNKKLSHLANKKVSQL